MTQLSLNLRAHDLPPRWDGDPVDWSPWQPLPAVTICPPLRTQGCDNCGSATRPLTCHGTRTIAYGPNVIPIGRSRLHDRHIHARLVVHRCPDCHHDTVFDPHTDQWWDLDDSDYQDAGSWEPTTGPDTHHKE